VDLRRETKGIRIVRLSKHARISCRRLLPNALPLVQGEGSRPEWLHRCSARPITGQDELTGIVSRGALDRFLGACRRTSIDTLTSEHRCLEQQVVLKVPR
jgi:hypothetical protein